MPKRLTATEKWDDPFFAELSPHMKLMWVYLTDKCDNTGVIDFSEKLALRDIGWEYDAGEVLITFGSRIRVLESGKWLIKKFATFQYGQTPKEEAPEPQETKYIVQQLREVYLKHMPTYAKDDTLDFEACRKIAQFLKKQLGLQTITEHGDKMKMLDMFGSIARLVKNDSFYSNKPLKTLANNIQQFYMSAAASKAYKPQEVKNRKLSVKERYLSPVKRDGITDQEWEAEYDRVRPNTARIDITYINLSYQQGSAKWKKAVMQQYYSL